MSEFKVTLKDVYDLVKDNDKTTQRIEKHCIKTNGNVEINKQSANSNRKLIYVLISAYGASFLFLIGWLIKLSWRC